MPFFQTLCCDSRRTRHHRRIHHTGDIKNGCTGGRWHKQQHQACFWKKILSGFAHIQHSAFAACSVLCDVILDILSFLALTYFYLCAALTYLSALFPVLLWFLFSLLGINKVLSCLILSHIPLHGWQHKINFNGAKKNTGWPPCIFFLPFCSKAFERLLSKQGRMIPSRVCTNRPQAPPWSCRVSTSNVRE